MVPRFRVFGSCFSSDNRIWTYAVEKQDVYCTPVVQLIRILISNASCAMTDIMVD